MADRGRSGRGRRKFALGVLEQAANILGAMTASVMVVGLLLPALAAATGQHVVSVAMFASAAWFVVGFAAFSGIASLTLRGLARRLEDDERDLAESEGGHD